MRLTFFFRRHSIHTHSIEEIFRHIYNSLINNTSQINASIIEVPYYSKSLIKIFKNIAFANKYQNAVNHITGDVHYIIFGFSNNNFNILTIHDCALMYRFSKTSIRYWIFKLIWIKWPVHKADMVTTISESTKKDIIRFSGCNPNKIVVIPNCVHPAFNYSRKETSKTPRILQIGTGYNKNLLRIIPALSKIDCVLDIIGVISKEQQNLLDKYEITFDNSVDISIEEMNSHYAMADIVLFVSTFEGFGMPIIEANQCGRPVITSNLSPMRDVASNAAHLVDPFSIENIRKGILYVLNNKKYANTLIENGLENVKRYSQEAVIKQYHDIYLKAFKLKES